MTDPRDAAGRTEADMVDKHVAARLRLRRLQVGVTEKATAHQFGVSVRKLARIEAGEVPIQAKWLDAACGLFGVRISYFFRGLPGAAASVNISEAAQIGDDIVWGRSLALASCFAMLAGTAAAEVSDITIARQPGFGFLPLVVMQQDRLVEKHARAAGLGDLTVHYVTVNNGATVNEGLLAGRIQVAAGGVPPFLILWDRTRGKAEVKALSAMASSPQYLLTRNPGVRTIADFSDRDRINVIMPKATLPAILLEMASAQTFGVKNYNKLDPLTVGLPAPDGVAQLISGHGGITADFIGAPFAYQELDTPGIHMVLRSEDLMGGPSTSQVVYTTSAFYEKNPKTMAAVMAALDEAISLAQKDRATAAQAFLKIDGKYPLQTSRMINDRSIFFSTHPRGVMKFAGFMHQIGSIRAAPTNWKDLFFSAEGDKLAGD